MRGTYTAEAQRITLTGTHEKGEAKASSHAGTIGDGKMQISVAEKDSPVQRFFVKEKP